MTTTTTYIVFIIACVLSAAAVLTCSVLYRKRGQRHKMLDADELAEIAVASGQIHRFREALDAAENIAREKRYAKLRENNRGHRWSP